MIAKEYLGLRWNITWRMQFRLRLLAKCKLLQFALHHKACHRIRHVIFQRRPKYSFAIMHTEEKSPCLCYVDRRLDDFFISTTWHYMFLLCHRRYRKKWRASGLCDWTPSILAIYKWPRIRNDLQPFVLRGWCKAHRSKKPATRAEIINWEST